MTIIAISPAHVNSRPPRKDHFTSGSAVMAHADWLIDLGPGGIVFEGTPTDLVAARSTLTGEHLAAYVAGEDSGCAGIATRALPTRAPIDA